MATPVHAEASRSVPVPVEQTYDAVLTAPLPSIFSRRYGPLPPIREVRDQVGEWGAGGVGQSRTIATADRGTMREELTVLEPPERFGYTLSRITGPMKPLVDHVEGMWAFAPAGTGTRITWTWTFHPANGAAGLVLPALARMWRGYARHGLEEIEESLV
jgi:hypothetical protein